MKKVIIKTPEQINNIRIAGKYLTELLLLIQSKAKSGITLMSLEHIAQQYIKKNKVKGSFKGYGGFPANLCLSNNDCLVHGIPDNTILKNGDVLKIDCGITYKGGISDAAITTIVGGDHANPQAAQLVESTKTGLDHCLQYIKPGNTIWERSSHIQDYIEDDGFAIIKHLTGHGVGIHVHEAPHIYNRREPSTRKHTFQTGMVIALEPITAIKSNDFYEGHNGRNLYTNGGDIGAQREYTLVVTNDGYEILAGVTNQ